MNRKLLILNFVLVAALAWAGFQYRHEWQSLQSREHSTLGRKVPPPAPPAFTAQPNSPAVMASSYADIADKMLFDRSRNPTVVVEVPPPPPPKPVPPMPVYHGQMNLGDGLVAVMSVNNAAPHQEIRLGQEIGPFKLVSLNRSELVLGWDGKEIHKSLDELSDHSFTGTPQQNNNPNASNAPPPPPPPPAAAPLGPGQDTGAGFRLCQAGDTNPIGSVSDGFRKTSVMTIMGPQCRWEPAR